MEVAARVFAAAIDEFGDRDIPSHPTHRMLAQGVAKKGVRYFPNLSPTKADQILESYQDIDRRVCQGYGMGAQLDETEVFQSLGFHIGSELLADEEFRILDRTLRREYPELVQYLEQTPVAVSGTSLPGYHWLRIHTSVEMDHFEHAVQAANVALQPKFDSLPINSTEKLN